MVDGLPRLGFLGVGWIGRQRMEAVRRAGAAEVAAIADVNAAAAGDAASAVGCETVCRGLPELLDLDLDGVVIATPTALHADQVRRSLERGIAAFCQKPLGRSAAECRDLVALARASGVPLGVDMSYRHTAAVGAALRCLRSGAIGEPYAAELIFHNAYGPDKTWVRDVRLAGGGALMDLGCHLVDLARMFLGSLRVTSVHADLYAGGRRLGPDPQEVEDLALAQVTLDGGRSLRVACSWWLPAGTDAVIEASFIAPRHVLKIRNVGGSFYDFEALLVEGRHEQPLAEPPDEWGGRALVDWSRRLSSGHGFDRDVEELVEVAELIDRIYGRPA